MFFNNTKFKSYGKISYKILKLRFKTYNLVYKFFFFNYSNMLLPIMLAIRNKKYLAFLKSLKKNKKTKKLVKRQEKYIYKNKLFWKKSIKLLKINNPLSCLIKKYKFDLIFFINYLRITYTLYRIGLKRHVLRITFRRRNIFFTLSDSYKVILNTTVRREGFHGRLRKQYIALETTSKELKKHIIRLRIEYFDIIFIGWSRFKFVLKKFLRRHYGNRYSKIKTIMRLVTPHNGCRPPQSKNRKRLRWKRFFKKKLYLKTNDKNYFYNNNGGVRSVYYFPPPTKKVILKRKLILKYNERIKT